MTYAVRYGKGKPGEARPIVEEHFIPPERAFSLYMDVDYPGPHYYICVDDCECQRPELARKRMERILGQAGIPDECYHFSFDQFNEHARRAAQFARAFVEQNSLFDEDGVERTGLLLAGTPGAGKTTLGSLTFLHRIQAGQAGVWVKYTDIVSKVRETYQDGYSGPSVADIRHTIQYAPFLMIDDLGSMTRTQTYAEDMIEFCFLVFDHRLAKRLPTLITTNLGADELEAQFGGPVASRLRGLCHVIIMEGKDHRRGT